MIRPTTGLPLRSRLTLAALGAVIALSALPSGALAAPTWLAPVDLSAAGHSGEEPQIALDPAGDAVAVWVHFDGTNEVVQAAERPAGGTWGAPVDLSEAGEDAGETQVAVDANGDAVAVWQRFDGSHDIVQAASLNAGGAWGPAVDLSATGESAFEPEVAFDPAGEAVAVWSRSDGTDDIIQAASRPAGGVWQPTAELSASGENAHRPDVQLDADGDAVAVWERYDGTDEVIQAAVRPPGGLWSTPADLSASGENAERPRLAVDPAGDAVAVWERYDGTNTIIQAASLAHGGSWAAAENLSVAGESASEPAVAIDPAGEAVATWERSDGTDFIVQAASRPAGGTWQAPVDLSAAGEGASESDVAFDPAGNAVAVWLRFDGSDNIVQAAERPAGGSWGPRENLSASGESAESPRVAVDPAGDAVAVWSRFDGSDYIVQAAAHDVAGPQLRALSIPATGTIGQPLAFSVSPFDVWSPLGATTWSFGDGASATGTAVSHAYGAPGTYTVKVTGADGLGNTSTATGTVSVAAAPQPAKGRATAERIVKVKGGTALLALNCAHGAGCAGTAQLSVPTDKAKSRAAASSKRKPKPIVIGKAAFKLAAGKHETIKVPLTKKGRALARAHAHSGLKAGLGGSGVVARGVILKAVGHRPRRR